MTGNGTMNKWQRAVLILGAALLVLVMRSAPTVQYAAAGRVVPGNTIPEFANVVDLQTATARSMAVVIPTMLLFWALKEVGKSKDDNTPGDQGYDEATKGYEAQERKEKQSAPSETKSQKPNHDSKPTLEQWMKIIEDALVTGKNVPQRVIDDYVKRGGKVPESRAKKYSQQQNKISQDEKMDRSKREDYAAELREIPASTWAEMPPMISILSGETNRSTEPKPYAQHDETIYQDDGLDRPKPIVNEVRLITRMTMFDKVFKIGLLVLGVLALLLFYNSSQKGRYQLNGPFVVDTQTGVTYIAGDRIQDK